MTKEFALPDELEMCKGYLLITKSTKLSKNDEVNLDLLFFEVKRKNIKNDNDFKLIEVIGIIEHTFIYKLTFQVCQNIMSTKSY